MNVQTAAQSENKDNLVGNESIANAKRRWLARGWETGNREHASRLDNGILNSVPGASGIVARLIIWDPNQVPQDILKFGNENLRNSENLDKRD